VHGVDAGLAGEGSGGAGVVAGEHGDVVAVAAQPGDDLDGLGAQLVAHRDRANEMAVTFDQYRGRSGVLHPFHLLCEVAGVEPAGAAQPQRVAVEAAGETGTGDRLDLRGRGDGPGGGEDRFGEGMLRADLQGRRRGENPVAAGAVGGGEVDDGGPVRGEGASLIQRDAADAAEGLEGGAALDQDTDFAGGADRGRPAAAPAPRTGRSDGEPPPPGWRCGPPPAAPHRAATPLPRSCPWTCPSPNGSPAQMSHWS
jgi:hypothetical protein